VRPFVVKDCALITLATGRRALNLRELRDGIETCSLASIEYHFYSSQLRPSFDDPEYHNDFALWARHALHDRPLAERLGVLDPLQYNDLESLRQALLDVVEERLSEVEFVSWSAREHEFIFLRGQVVVFDTGLQAVTASELARLIPHLSTGSVFYHFVESRRRPPVGLDDFSAWLATTPNGPATLAERLSNVNHYFVSLTELREQLEIVFDESLAADGAQV
jgi:hypothetical protein